MKTNLLHSAIIDLLTHAAMPESLATNTPPSDNEHYQNDLVHAVNAGLKILPTKKAEELVMELIKTHVINNEIRDELIQNHSYGIHEVLENYAESELLQYIGERVGVESLADYFIEQLEHCSPSFVRKVINFELCKITPEAFVEEYLGELGDELLDLFSTKEIATYLDESRDLDEVFAEWDNDAIAVHALRTGASGAMFERLSLSTKQIATLIKHHYTSPEIVEIVEKLAPNAKPRVRIHADGSITIPEITIPASRVTFDK